MIERDIYLQKLVNARGNGFVKVITGLRRVGKTYLVMTLFKDYLLNEGVPDDHIIDLKLDIIENESLLDRHLLYDRIIGKIKDDGPYYVLLDEIQLVDGFEKVLLSLLERKNVECYVTGSNAKFLSDDILTEFRGRGWQIHLNPLSFSEFFAYRGGDSRAIFREYSSFGGLPKICSFEDPLDKRAYLRGVFDQIYLKDILQRHRFKDERSLGETLDFLASSTSSLISPTKISNTFKSQAKANVDGETVASYLKAFASSFLIRQVKRYDIKGRQYIETPCKYYFADIGLRNARIDFRQAEDQPSVLENIIYNELLARGYLVDIGSVASSSNGKRSQYEVDFVCHLPGDSKRYYVQSAFSLPSREKREAEEKPLLLIKDSHKKIIITQDEVYPFYDDHGVLTMNVIDFLLDSKSLDK